MSFTLYLHTQGCPTPIDQVIIQDNLAVDVYAFNNFLYWTITPDFSLPSLNGFLYHADIPLEENNSSLLAEDQPFGVCALFDISGIIMNTYEVSPIETLLLLFVIATFRHEL